MAYLEELLPEFRNGAKIRQTNWDKEKYIFYTGTDVHDNNDKTVKIDGYQLATYEWELYQEPIDWQYIIENKCLCAFWNKEGCEFLGFLKQRSYYKDKDFYTYISLTGAIYVNCRPVRRDEVTFYEDRKDD